MTTTQFTEGDWTFSRGADYTWTATDSAGRTVGPRDTVADLRRDVYDASREQNPQITVVGGPGRAISARRFTKSFTD